MLAYLLHSFLYIYASRFKWILILILNANETGKDEYCLPDNHV